MLRRNVQLEILDTSIHAGLANQLHITEFSTLHLNPREVELIQTLIPKREGLIKTATMGKKFLLNVDRKSYWLYTNSPKDNERFAAAVREHGFDHGLELLAGTHRS